MAQLQATFDFPVELIPEAELSLTQEHRQQLRQGQLVIVLQEDQTSVAYQQLEGSELVLRLGASKPPWLLRHANALMLGLLVACLLAVSLLWAWPHWRQLVAIREAAIAFDSGDYSARAHSRAGSSLGAITQAFNLMAERTQRGIQAHKELTSAVSHELRTPLARMRFSLEMLAMSAQEADRQRHIQSLDREVEELHLMLEELLSYARMDYDSVQFQLEQVEVNPWLEAIAAAVRPEPPCAVRWTLAQGSPLIMEVDARLMRRAAENVVHNALRHAQRQILVELTVESGWCRLRVDDDGPGIPEDQRERLFEPFATLEASRTKSASGFGLGLAIVRRIVQAHRGQATLGQSELGGARVELRWPMRRDEAPVRV